MMTFTEAVELAEREGTFGKMWRGFQRALGGKFKAVKSYINRNVLPALEQGKESVTMYRDLVNDLKITNAGDKPMFGPGGDKRGPLSKLWDKLTGTKDEMAYGAVIEEYLYEMVDRADLRDLRDVMQDFFNKYEEDSRIERSIFPLKREINKRLNRIFGVFEASWQISLGYYRSTEVLPTQELKKFSIMAEKLERDFRALEQMFQQIVTQD